MEHTFSDVDEELEEAVLSHDHNRPLMLRITKLYSTGTCE